MTGVRDRDPRQRNTFVFRPAPGPHIVADIGRLHHTGLHLQGPGKFNSPNLEGIELTWNQNRTDVLFEDLRVEGYKVGMNVRLGRDVTVRRSAIHDNALIGLAANDNDGLLIEENVIDNNGIDQNTNHNIYKGPRTDNVVVRNNVITRGGNYGLKWRAPSGGGEISGNLFAGNRNDLSLHLDTEDAPDLMNDDIRILNNVFVESGRGDQQTPIFLAHASNILVQGNLIANMNSTPYGQAIRLAYNLAAPNSLSDVRITGNTVANFTGTGFGLLTSDYARVRVDGNTFQGLTRHNVSVRAEFRPFVPGDSCLKPERPALRISADRRAWRCSRACSHPPGTSPPPTRRGGALCPTPSCV